MARRASHPKNQAIQASAAPPIFAPISVTALRNKSKESSGPKGLPWCTPLSPRRTASMQNSQLCVMRDQRAHGYSAATWFKVLDFKLHFKSLHTDVCRGHDSLCGVTNPPCKHAQTLPVMLSANVWVDLPQ